MELSFKTRVTKAEIWGINEHLGASKDLDIDTSPSIVHIEYVLQPELRRWGIKGVYVSVERVMISVDWEVDGYDVSEEETAALVKAGGEEYRNGYNHAVCGVIEIELDGLSEWTIYVKAEFHPDGTFAIDCASIDLVGKTITLS